MSGIAILRRLLMKEAAKDSGRASGILSIGDSVRKLADRKLDSYIISAKKQGIDLDAMNEQQIKYILELNKPQNKMRVISQGDPEFQGIMEALLGKRGQVIEGKFGKPFAEEIKKFRGPVKEKQDMGEFGKINVEVDYSASLNRPEFFDPKAKNMYGETVATGPEFIKKEKERILNTINRKKNEMVPTTHPNYKLLKKSLQDQEDALEAIKITEDLGGNENMFDFLRTKNISDYKSKNLKRSDYVKTDDPEDLATGGRVGLKAGMSRRAFLALMGSAGAGIGAAKTGLLKLFGKGAGKQATKEIIKTPPVPGKPEWFDSLVNKVITQGDDVTKNLAIKERQSVHKLQIDEMDDVTVYRNLDDGEIRVSYDSPNNMGEQPVDLVFKPGSGQTDEVTGKVADEFYAVEVEPRGVRTGPDDFDIEFDGENLASSVDELVSDTSKLKQVATDKKPTMKEFIESKNKKDKTRAINEDQVEQAEYLETKYGPGPEDVEDFASGGRVGLFLGGGLTAGKSVVREFIKNLAKEKGISGSEMMKVLNPKAYQKFLNDPAMYKKYDPETGLMATDKVKKFIKETEVARGDQLERLIEMIKTRIGADENIEKMISRAVQETGASREEIEPLIRTMISMKAGRRGENLIPSNVSEEALLEMEQMLKNIRTKDRQMNAGGGIARMLGE